MGSYDCNQGELYQLSAEINNGIVIMVPQGFVK